jgi:hypothetical protein
MSNNILDDSSAEKTQLGMGELWAIITTGTNVPDTTVYIGNKTADWSFLEIAADTVITAMEFTPDDGSGAIAVTRYNTTFLNNTLMPPVYGQKSGSWTSITCEGFISCYGKFPIG